MSGKVSAIIAGLALGVAVAPVWAQGAGQQAQDQGRGSARRQNQLARQQAEARYQVLVMERVLEDAVEHGASLWRDRLQVVLPAQTLLLDNARVIGYRIEDYGVFFNVEVPSLETTMTWAVRTLDQNELGLESAIKAVRAHVDASGDPNLDQAWRRVELQVAPLGAPGGAGGDLNVAARTVSGSAAFASDAAAPGDPTDPILSNPEEVFRAEVVQSVIDSMLDHSSALGLSANEWLTIGARRNEVRPRIGPLDSKAPTFVIRVRGSDLTAYRSGQLSREDAIKRVEVRVN
ncbi:MAG: hypothetical protein ABI868_08745 [Acidobacteriota bacterium]